MNPTLPSQEFRRSIYRTIRRQVLALDPQSDLLTFGKGVLASFVENLGAQSCGIVVHFKESTRDLVLFRDAKGAVSRNVMPYQPPEEVPEECPGFTHPELSRQSSQAESQPAKVFRYPIKVRDEILATIELGDPDTDIVPSVKALSSIIFDIAPVFELTFLYSRVRQERLESELLNRITRELGSSLDVESLLDSILTSLRKLVTYDAAGIFLLGLTEDLGPVSHSIQGYPQGSDDLLHLKLGQGIVGWTAKTGEPQIVGDVHAAPRYVEARPETRSEMVVPLTSGGRILGVFNLESNRPDAYTPHDLEMLMRFARQAAVALERARLLREEADAQRLEQEVEIARSIQGGFLPALTGELKARGFAGHTQPSLEVSGDYYDIIPMENNDVVIAIADVCGKGIPASLIMSSLRSAFHLEIKHSKDPGEWCRDLNALLVPSLRETEFITACFARLSADQRELIYSNAGHNPPIVLRKDGSVEFLDTGGTILGSFPDVPYETGCVSLESGDRVIFYTDGVTEAFGPGEEEFGTDRLLEVVKSRSRESAQAMTDGIVQAVLKFSAQGLADDLTVVVISGPQ